MNFQKLFLYGSLFIIFLTGCMDESPWKEGKTDGKGVLKINLSATTEVISDIPQQRSIPTEIVGPDETLFNIRLTSQDGSYAKVWESVEEFAKEESFPANTYCLEAYYGSEKSQGIVKEEDEGFENAFYYAVQDDVLVEAGKSTVIELHAKLLNSIVTVEYADAFKNYFVDWATTLIPEGASSLALHENECLCYVKPGKIDVIIRAELPDGRKIEINPASFETLPQHLYKIKYNIYNGEIDALPKLEIIFNDSLEEGDRVVIDLSDELIQGEGPQIYEEGFNPSDVIEILEGNQFSGTLKYTVLSEEGITEAILKVESNSYHPSFLKNGEIDLCKADESQKSEMRNYGINIIGFSDKSSKMSLLDISGMVSLLPEGYHKISLIVKDRGLRAHNSNELHINTLPINCKIMGSKAIFGDGFAEISISYNGLDPTVPGNNPFSFKVDGDFNAEDVRILSINGQEYYTRSFEDKEYIYKISLPEASRDIYPVTLYYNGSKVSQDNIDLEFPEFELEYDAYTTSVIARIKNETDITKLRLYTNRLRLFDSTKELVAAERNTSSGTIKVAGLSSDSQLTLKGSMEAKSVPDKYYGYYDISTEKEAQIPNGDFENIENYINATIWQGGEYTVNRNLVGSETKHNEETYNIDVPSRWANVNSKTCNFSQSKTQNTWFLVPSTYITSGYRNNGVTIRNVGYNLNGNVPATTGSWTSSTQYNTNTPDEIYTAAGKLFLGEYNVGISNYSISTETYSHGIEFNSRPSILKGYYKYTSHNSDSGFVTVKIKNGDTILASGEMKFTEAGTWTPFEIELKNYPFGVKPTSLELFFASSEGANDSWTLENGNIPVYSTTENTQKYLGSELVIDEIEFEY